MKLILLRKYGSKGQPVFVEEIKRVYLQKSGDAVKILNEYHSIINRQMEQN